MTNPNWINDPSLQKINKNKLMFLEKVINQGSSLKGNQKEMMSFILTLSKISKENNISFTPDEISLVYSVLEKYRTS